MQSTLACYEGQTSEAQGLAAYRFAAPRIHIQRLQELCASSGSSEPEAAAERGALVRWLREAGFVLVHFDCSIPHAKALAAARALRPATAALRTAPSAGPGEGAAFLHAVAGALLRALAAHLCASEGRAGWQALLEPLGPAAASVLSVLPLLPAPQQAQTHMHVRLPAPGGCAVCGAAGLFFRCPPCGAGYCSTACRAAHAPQHDASCPGLPRFAEGGYTPAAERVPAECDALAGSSASGLLTAFLLPPNGDARLWVRTGSGVCVRADALARAGDVILVPGRTLQLASAGLLSHARYWLLPRRARPSPAPTPPVCVALHLHAPPDARLDLRHLEPWVLAAAGQQAAADEECTVVRQPEVRAALETLLQREKSFRQRFAEYNHTASGLST